MVKFKAVLDGNRDQLRLLCWYVDPDTFGATALPILQMQELMCELYAVHKLVQACGVRTWREFCN